MIGLQKASDCDSGSKAMSIEGLHGIGDEWSSLLDGQN